MKKVSYFSFSHFYSNNPGDNLQVSMAILRDSRLLSQAAWEHQQLTSAKVEQWIILLKSLGKATYVSPLFLTLRGNKTSWVHTMAYPYLSLSSTVISCCHPQTLPLGKHSEHMSVYNLTNNSQVDRQPDTHTNRYIDKHINRQTNQTNHILYLLGRGTNK